MTDGLVSGRRGRAAACVFVAAITLLVLLLQANSTARSGPEDPHEDVLLSADSEEIQQRYNPNARTGDGFHFFPVNGFDEDSLKRRVRIDAAEQAANAERRDQTRRQKREAESENGEMVSTGVHGNGAWGGDRAEDGGGVGNGGGGRGPAGSGQDFDGGGEGERNDAGHIPVGGKEVGSAASNAMWTSPFRTAEASSSFRPVAPKGFVRQESGGSSGGGVGSYAGGGGDAGGGGGIGGDEGEGNAGYAGESAGGESAVGLLGFVCVRVHACARVRVSTVCGLQCIRATHTCINACMRTYIQACMHAYMPTHCDLTHSFSHIIGPTWLPSKRGSPEQALQQPMRSRPETDTPASSLAQRKKTLRLRPRQQRSLHL